MNESNGGRIALITDTNQGVGFQVAKELVASGLTVLVGPGRRLVLNGPK